MNPDVVIVGGGIMGTASAYYLAKAGAKVHLVERGPMGGAGASKSSQMAAVTWEGPQIHIDLALASRKEYLKLQEELPIDFELRKLGGLLVFLTPEDMESFKPEYENLERWGSKGQIVTAEELRKEEPHFAPGLGGGIFYEKDLGVYPMHVTEGFTASLQAMGGIADFFTEVTGFEFDQKSGRVNGVKTDKGTIHTKNVVIAAGAWSGLVGNLAGLSIPIVPRKGTLIITEPVPTGLINHELINEAGYLKSVTSAGTEAVPGSPVINRAANGNLMLGSSREYKGFDTTVDPMVMSTILARILKIVPKLGEVHAIRSWAGLRPSCKDLLPIISAVDEIGGLYIASGHEGIGITEGPITGKLVSQMILGEKLDLNIEKLKFSRFSSTHAMAN
jgi:glycine/D-amino acid oxidase-like deaminating enzyme